MVKEFSISVAYGQKCHVFQCSSKKFLDTVAKYFKINASDVDIYAIWKNTRRKISPDELTDRMKVQIVHRGASTNGSNQRSLHSYFGDEASKEKSFLQNIMIKLSSQDTTLNWSERKYLTEMLKNFPDSRAAKRKWDDSEMTDQEKVKMINKKVQVQVSTLFSKESVAQTDLVSPDLVIAEREDTLRRIEKLANSDEVNQEEASILLERSFDDRRTYILLEFPLVKTIKNKYPQLFSLKEVKKELDRLFYRGKCKEFMDNIDKYSCIILEECSTDNEIYRRTEKSLSRCYTKEQQKYVTAVGSILAVPFLVDEHLGFVNTLDNEGESDVHPFIDASVHSLKEFFFDNLLFKIIAEEQLICEASNFKEAILCLMASFFIFHIRYTKGCESTLAIFENLYLCPTKNLKTEIHPHVQELIKLFKHRGEC